MLLKWLTHQVTLETLDTLFKPINRCKYRMKFVTNGRETMDPPSTLILTTWVPYIHNETLSNEYRSTAVNHSSRSCETCSWLFHIWWFQLCPNKKHVCHSANAWLGAKVAIDKEALTGKVFIARITGWSMTALNLYIWQAWCLDLYVCMLHANRQTLKLMCSSQDSGSW